MSDVLLHHTNDNGEITVAAGIMEMTAGLDTAAYLSLFGGNQEDPANIESSQTWWGNVGVADKSKQYRSRTQHIIYGLPPIPINLKRIEDAARADLAWFVVEKVATSVTVSASLIDRNKVSLVITIEADGSSQSLEFITLWEAST